MLVNAIGHHGGNSCAAGGRRGEMWRAVEQVMRGVGARLASVQDVSPQQQWHNRNAQFLRRVLHEWQRHAGHVLAGVQALAQLSAYGEMSVMPPPPVSRNWRIEPRQVCQYIRAAPVYDGSHEQCRVMPARVPAVHSIRWRRGHASSPLNYGTVAYQRRVVVGTSGRKSSMKCRQRR